MGGCGSLALDWLGEDGVCLMILDIDTPTGWKGAMDVYSSGNLLEPDTFFVVATHDTNNPIARQFAAKGVFAIVKRPFGKADVDKMMAGERPDRAAA